MNAIGSGTGNLSVEQRELLALLLAEEGLAPEEEAGIPRRREDGDLPLSFPQQRLWFLQQLEGGAAYNVPSSVHLNGAFDPAALAGALSAIVRRHESLRTFFVLSNGQPVQRIAPAAPLSLPLLDLRALPAERRPEEARRLGTEEIHRPFDLAQAPMVRSTLVWLDDCEHVLFLLIHHI
ncbi:MAG TPA: condensation domain-containing protein, partial [Thermoanaerobaculia bacterium]